MNLITVIILTYNQRENTLACLESLLAITAPEFAVLVWDNGSTDGTVEAVAAQYPTVLIHHADTNLGVASGRNHAAQLANQHFDPAYYLFLDNDMKLESNFVAGLLAPFKDDSVGQTQAKLRFMDRPERLNDAGGSRISFVLGQTIPVGYDEIDKGQHDQIKDCVSCGGAMMVRRDVFAELNGFDPIFDPFGPEDADFSLRLKQAGYQALYTPDAVAYHAVSHTFGKGYTEDYARLKARHWFVFMHRHATWWQKLGFYAIGMPLMGLRLVLREARRGNLGAVRGVFRGLMDR